MFITKRTNRFTALALGCLGVPFLLQAQQTTATLVGTITDPSNAVIAGAIVAVINIGTGVHREARTDGTGSYSVPFLVAGEYKVVASSSGFRPKDVSRLVLQLGQTARVDFQMELGDVNQNIDVEAYAAALQTENATVGSVIDSTKIVELPLNGRNFVQLA